MTEASGSDPRGEGLQKIDLKLPLHAPGRIRSEFILDVFGRWRLEPDQEIIDLADYAHVPEGPGCILVSHRGHFGVDFEEGRAGLFLSTRKGLSGAPADRVAAALRTLLETSRRLLADSATPRDIRPDLSSLVITFNDRLQAPNTDASDAIWRPAVEATIRRLHGEAKATIERAAAPGSRLSYRVFAPGARGLTLEVALARI